MLRHDICRLQQVDRKLSSPTRRQRQRVLLMLLGGFVLLLGSTTRRRGWEQRRKVVTFSSAQDMHLWNSAPLPAKSSLRGYYNNRIRNLDDNGEAATNSRNLENECDQDTLSNKSIWFILQNVLCIVASVAFVAVISGLFLGLLTLDPLDLQIIIKASISEEEKQHAAILLPFVEEHHRVMVTLLIVDGLAYETLPIFMENLMPTWVAILLSVTLVLFFGEVLPMAYFMGPNQLELGTKLAPLMRFFLIVLYPVAGPLAKLLDYIVHENGEDPNAATKYNRDELSALVRIQYEERMKKVTKPRRGLAATTWFKTDLAHQRKTPDQATWRALKKDILMEADAMSESAADNKSDTSSVTDEYVLPSVQDQLNPPLHFDEVNMVEGALQLKTKVAFDVYTPLRQIYAIPSSMILDKGNVMDIYSEGYSRIPVYKEDPKNPKSRSRILGILMTRLLIVVDWDHEREVDTIPLQTPPAVSPKTNLVELTRLFQSCGSHIALVCAQVDLANEALENERPLPVEAGFMGIVTLEDVLEELLQDAVHDELDVRDRDWAAARLTRWASQKLKDKKRKRLKATQAALTTVPRRTANSMAADGAGQASETTPLL